MYSNLAKRSNIRARNSIFDSVKDGCWLYRWFQLHSFILLFKVLFRPLVKQDMFNLSQQFWPETNYMAYGRLKKIHSHYTAGKIILEMIKVDMIIACVIACFQAGFGFAGPIILKYILRYLNSSQPTQQGRSLSYALAGLWLFFSIVKTYLREYWIRLASLCATKTQVTLNTQFYRKTMRVSFTYKKYMNIGQFYSYWFVDTTIITACIINFPHIVGAPTTLILSVIFVCIEVGTIGLLLLVVIVVAIIIELLIDMEMASIYAHKLTKYDFKLIENIHMYKQFKELRGLSWENMIVNENIRFRTPENSLNRTYYILGQIYLFITNFAPVLVIFILIVVGQYSNNQHTWGTTIVFTVIGYIGTISLPLRNLPNVISRLMIVQRVFKRIQNFLDADQLKKNEDIYLQEGTLEIKKWIISTGTPSSIDRLIVRQSIMVPGEDSMFVHIKNLPIQVRMYHTLDYINEQEIKKFKKFMKCLEVPYTLKYKKGDVVIILSEKSGSGKTSFIRGFLGTLNVEAGQMKFSGKLGYVSPRDFYLSKSIKDNVVFGEPFSQQRLKRAYILSGLSQELNKFTQGDQTIVDSTIDVIAISQKCIISLARAIYYDADILLMDDVFQEFEVDECHSLYNRICQTFSHKLVIISTNMIHFIKRSDNVIILQDRKAIQVGTFQQLKQNQNSKIHLFRIKDIQLLHYRSMISQNYSKQSTTTFKELNLSQISLVQTNKQISRERKNNSSLRNQSMELSSFQQILISSTYHLIKQDQNIKLKTPLPPTQLPVLRPTPVQGKYYLQLLKNGGWSYLVTFLFIAVANGVATFSTWLIGSLTRSPFGLGIGGVLILYACLQVAFGVLLLIYGMFIPSVATMNIQTMSNKFNHKIAKAKISEFQKFSSVHLCYIFGGDNQNFYTICDNLTNVFSSIVTLISTVVIMGLASYLIFIVAGVVVLYTILVYYIFRISAQEVFVLGGAPKKYFFRVLEDSVIGTQTFQYYDKVQWFRMKFYDGIYMFSAIWRTNLRFITHAFNILCGFAEIILMGGILYLAIANKQVFTQSSTIFVNVAVSASPKILGSIFVLLNNLSNMAAQINVTIKIPNECFKNKSQQNYNSPQKPMYWPWNGKIQFRNVTLQKKEIKKPLLDKINLVIESGEVIGMYSDYDNDINALFSMLCGFTSPKKNDGSYAGEVLVSDCNVAQIGQTYVTQVVVLLDSTPICFNGSIKFNVDPFNKYSDQQIEQALEAVKFWEEMDQNNQKNNRLIEGFRTLDFVIQQRGEQLPTIILQKLNFARAYLKKPKILLLQRAISKIQESKTQDFYYMTLSIFRNCTIIILTLNLHYLMRCDRIITLRNGKIIEQGRPRELATNPSTRLYQMIRVLAQSDYLIQKPKLSN